MLACTIHACKLGLDGFESQIWPDFGGGGGNEDASFSSFEGRRNGDSRGGGAARARHLLNNQGGRRQPNACSCFQATHINVREGFFISEVFLYYCLAWITKHPFWLSLTTYLVNIWFTNKTSSFNHCCKTSWGGNMTSIATYALWFKASTRLTKRVDVMFVCTQLL